MNLVHNKQNAIAFYKMAYEGNPREAVKLYVGDEYIQHNPMVADGPEAFIRYFERICRRNIPKNPLISCGPWPKGIWSPCKRIRFGPGNDQYVTMDFFRFDENGKNVEHWDGSPRDSIQQIPETSANENTMY